ncbi:hypothetical protein SK128_006442 [Halocaridina rubra]|uniref:Uncharacterized protein n=1 Tax=Halocaridina rubra TaxID=373956 RepID=A0AAN8WJT8_HALRR
MNVLQYALNTTNMLSNHQIKSRSLYSKWGYLYSDNYATNFLPFCLIRSTTTHIRGTSCTRVLLGAFLPEPPPILWLFGGGKC